MTGSYQKCVLPEKAAIDLKPKKSASRSVISCDILLNLKALLSRKSWEKPLDYKNNPGFPIKKRM